MNPIANRNTFFVKKPTCSFKAASNYDILNEQGQPILLCREERLGFFTKMMRFTDYRNMTPFEVIVRTPDGQPVLCIKRGWTFFRSKVDVLDENGQRVGGFLQKLFSIGGAFTVLSATDQPLCVLQGKWTSWEFSFKAENNELARVTKKWAGLGKELFTSADNYVLTINDHVPPNNPVRLLILGAVLCIDKVLKEK